MLAVSSNDGQFLAVLPQGVKLVGKGGLELLPSNVGQLGLCHQRLGLGPDELLLEHNNLGRIGLFVLQVGNLIRNVLFAYDRVSRGSKHPKREAYGLCSAEQMPRCCGWT